MIKFIFVVLCSLAFASTIYPTTAFDGYPSNLPASATRIGMAKPQLNFTFPTQKLTRAGSVF